MSNAVLTMIRPAAFLLLVAVCSTGQESSPSSAPLQDSESSKLAIRIVEGQNAINNIQRNSAYEPVVEVQDSSGRVIPGASVVFTLPTVGPGGIFTDGSRTLMVQTGADGRATARGLKPNNQVGQFEIRVTASHEGQSTSVTVTQTNAAPVVSNSRSSKKWAILLAVIGGGVAAAALGASGGGGGSSSTPPAADPISGSVVPGAPGFGPPQ